MKSILTDFGNFGQIWVIFLANLLVQSLVELLLELFDCLGLSRSELFSVGQEQIECLGVEDDQGLHLGTMDEILVLLGVEQLSTRRINPDPILIGITTCFSADLFFGGPHDVEVLALLTEVHDDSLATVSLDAVSSGGHDDKMGLIRLCLHSLLQFQASLAEFLPGRIVETNYFLLGERQLNAHIYDFVDVRVTCR